MVDENIILRTVREQTEILAGRRGRPEDWAVRNRQLDGLRNEISNIAIKVATKSVPDAIASATEGLSTDIQAAQSTADAAAAAAAEVDTKAQGVRDDHDELVAGFTGALGTAFDAVNTDISSLNAAITSEATARANADDVLAAVVSTLDGSVGALSANVTDILGLTVSGTEAFGMLMTQLEVDANGSSAKIAQHGAAIADLEGNASATQVFRTKAGSAGAELELVAASDADGQASVARISATNILLNGSVSLEFLTVGIGRNALTGARFRGGIEAWREVASPGLAGDETTFSLRFPPETWSGVFFPTLMIHQNGISTDGSYVLEWRDITRADGSVAPGAPVAPGEYWEVSAFVSAHRCTATIDIIFYDTSGNEVAGSPSVPIAETRNVGILSSSSAPDLWPRVWQKSIVPAGAAFATLRITKDPTSSEANSFVFLHKPQIAKSHEFSVLPSPFSEDGSAVIGPDGILANAVTADKINVTDLSAISANLGTIQVGQANIADAAVVNAKIGDLAVNTLKIQDQSVTIMRSVNGTTSATIVFTPAADSVIVIFAGITFPTSFNGETGFSGGGIIQIKRNGNIVRSAESFFDGILFHSVNTVAGIQETITVDGSAGSAASNARLVILERFK